MTAKATSHQFQAETKQVLDIVVNSLYKDKEEATVEDCAHHCDQVTYCRGFEYFKATKMCHLVGHGAGLLKDVSGARSLRGAGAEILKNLKKLKKNMNFLSLNVSI